MKRNKFSLSHYKLFSCDMGELVPVGCVEVLPGDSFQHSTSALVRCSPLITPVMHPVDVRIHHWFVPTRIVWPNFENFITGGPDGMNASEFPVILFGAGGRTAPAQGSLADYFGIPPGTNELTVSAVPFRAYAKIWNEWYRDQDLQTPLTINEGDGTDATTSIALQNVAWEKDYFTSARLFTQKGPDVTLPLGTTAPVIPDGVNPPEFLDFTGTSSTIGTAGGSGNVVWSTGVQGGGATSGWGDETGLMADLSLATSVSINAVREAFALQRYEEARARYGSRYTEYLRYLGVRSSDARLQRPEYLGGGKQTIQFSEVLQSSPTVDGEDTQPLGTLGGHGITALRSNRYRRFFEEHGYVISVMSVKPKTMYADGIARTWQRRIKEDFWQRELQHIGQQAIFNSELYHAAAEPDGTFGYQDRYDEYRRAESGIAGEFRTTLNHWHYARLFDSEPALNADFIRSVPTKRVNAIQSEDVLWVMAKHNLKARRMVAGSGTSYIF